MVQYVMDIIGDTRIIDLNRSSILAFADDIAILGHTQEVIKTIKKLIQVSEKMGLIISKEKTKYMIVYWKENILGGIINNSNNNIKIGEYTFKYVDSFKHFRTLINSKTEMHCEIKKKN